MTLILSFAALSCVLGLQTDSPAVATAQLPPSTPAAQANGLPDSTFACVTLSPSAAQFEALAASPLVQVLADGLELQGLDIRGWMTATMEALGLDDDDLRTFAGSGVTFGLIEVTGDPLPGWLLLVPAGDRIETLASAVDTARQRASDAGIPAQKTSIDGRSIWVLRHPWSPLCWTRSGQTLVVGSSMLAVSAAAARLADPSAAGSLALDPTFAEFAGRNLVAGNLLTAYLRPSATLGALQPLIPSALAPTIAALRRALDLDRIAGIGATLASNGQAFEERVEVAWPEPRTGLLAQLVGHRTALSPGAIETVPNGTSSFSIASADLGRVLRSAAALFEGVAPGPFAQARKQVGDWTQKTGLDLEADVVATLGGQIATLQWLDPTHGSADVAVVVELADRDRLERSINKLLPALGAPVSRDAIAGYRAYSLSSNGDPAQPGLALTEGHLVFASSRTALQHALDRLAGRTPALQAPIPSGQIAFGMTDLTATLGFVMNELRRSRSAAFARLGRPAPTAGPSELALRAILAAGAVATSTVETDTRRLVYSARSDIGPLTLVGLALALPRTQQTAQTAARQLDAHASVRLALSKLAAAERALRADGGSAPFLPLRALIDSGVVDAQTAGTPLSDNLYTRDGFLLTALLPPAPADDFVIVAWPADNRTGAVFAADARGTEATNEIIARAVGVSLIELADVYADGFGSQLRSGWRQQALVATEEPAAPAKNSVQQAFEAITALERTPPTGKELPAVLAEALRSDHPALVARASRALGVLRRSDQIASLVQLASEHPDSGVRLQAMWALTRMRDARAQPAALLGLQSNDATLRALAATILGTQRVRTAGPALLRVAADPATPSDEQDRSAEQDRIAAITALADIGDQDQLLGLAAAVTSGSPAVAQALTYAFQTLSPQLGPDAEATTLVAVLGHSHGTLRRYAIQRLAELRVPATARALEGRLGREGRELLPLLQVAITQVRGDHTGVERSLTERAEELWATLRQTWTALPVNQRYAAGCGALILLLILGIGSTARARARNRAAGEAWAALAAPSAPEFAADADGPDGFGDPEYGDADPAYAYDDPAADEVELDIGASGVFRADEYEHDDLLPASSDADEGTRR